MSAIEVWSEFGLAVVLIVVSGSQLARYGDIISERTGLGGAWIGLVLVATVTSLPELVTGISAVVLVDATDIAVGALLGSCVFNLLIIVVLDYLLRGETVFARVSQDHVLAAAFSVLIIGVVGFNVLLEEQGYGLSIGHVGIYSPIILVLYVISVRAVFLHGRAKPGIELGEGVERETSTTLRQATIRFSLAAIVVIATGLWLPFIGQRLSIVLGVDETFVGSLFIAFATSLPEVVVTIAAMRIGAFNMAMSNLFGSNLFNILILVPADLLFTRGSILGFVSPLHTLSAVSAMMMTGIAIVGLMYRSQGLLFRRVGWVSLFLLSIYLMNFYILYLYG